MKLLVCGAGRITDELLKRVSLSWEVILIDKEKSRLSPFSNRFPGVVRVITEDASSPVVLERAGMKEQDCVLAMTNDDSANLAIARFAQEAGIKTVLAVVRDPEKLPEFRRIGVWTVTMATDAARKAYQFIKDPRIRVISLGEGEGELIELAVEKEDEHRLTDVVSRKDTDWRIAGIFRKNQLIFPDEEMVPQMGDRLLILGRADLYARFSSRLAENQLHFPRTYGRQMVLGLEDNTEQDTAGLLNEAFYLVQATHVETTRVVVKTPSSEVRSTLERWSESLEINTLETDQDPMKAAQQIVSDNETGFVVIHCPRQSFLKAMYANAVTRFASRLSCPLLCARASDPYERLLVPFNGSLEGQRAIEIAIDLAQQLNASISVIIVVEPVFLKGDPADVDAWQTARLKQIRELSRVHNVGVKELVVHGNPVKKIAEATENCDLLVLGIKQEGVGIFSLDVAGMIINRISCSVLVV